MNPLVVARAASGLALPVAAAVGARRRRVQQRERVPVRALERDSPSSALPRVSSRQLRALVAQGAGLREYDLRRARLGGLDLAAQDLSGIDLTRASLRKARLAGADLRGAVLDDADLSRANLAGADLYGASLREADLAGAELTGADLGGCRQWTTMNVRGARFDRTTRWPAGFDPSLAGAAGPAR